MTGTAADALLMGPDLSPDLQELADTIKTGGFGEQETHCPAHDDHNPSLVITDTDDKVLIYCRAGCSTVDVLSALGLSFADLYAPEADEPPSAPAGVPEGLPVPYPARCTYTWVNENGTPLFTTKRTPSKDFPVYAANGTPGLNGTRRVLYRLPEVLAALETGAEIHLAEGEKDADALTLAGVTATTNLGGAANWKDADADTLKGASMVVVWRDRDAAGEKRSAKVGETLAARGIPYRVVMSRVEDEKADAYDHLAAGWSVADAVPVTGAEVATVAAGRQSWMSDEIAAFMAVEGNAKAVAQERVRRMVRKTVDAYEASEHTIPVESVSDALDAILNGTARTASPTVGLIEGHRMGHGLFYEAHVNGIYGDGTIGKSVMLGELHARTLTEGGIVVHWEYDNNDQYALLTRLLNAGARAEDIRHRFHVLRTTADRDALTPEVKANVKLITLDAMNSAITSRKLDPYHPSGVDMVIQECFAEFTLHGACGVFIDHVGHGDKDRQAGSVRKSQAVQGSLYEVQKVATLSPGSTGRSRLVLRKDNRGAMAHLLDRAVATAVMTSTAAQGQPGKVSTVFEEPDPFNEERSAPAPVNNVERIIRELDAAGVPDDASIRGAKGFLALNHVEIKHKTDDFSTAISARKLRLSPSPGTTSPGERGTPGVPLVSPWRGTAKAQVSRGCPPAVPCTPPTEGDTPLYPSEGDTPNP
ncbi:bifunctional DNA primase/helicase [Streptomyces fulvoviolaceus]|uniref:bifunctional DNA primase/helicase n=1 Tax=Streptomyces fulvoviolaceus TaxID=285535 RepID=UPI0004C6769E|nr:bifunctional DNA primase/helicase [Streptomyces fulvoviolaceus]